MKESSPPKNPLGFGSKSSSSTALTMNRLKNVIYRKSYFIGITSIRRVKSLRRRLSNTISGYKGVASDLGDTVVRSCKVFVVKNGLNLDEVTSVYDKVISGNKTASKRGLWSIAKYWSKTTALGAWHLIKNTLRSPNYVMPIVATGIFVCTIVYANTMNYALKVTYNGEEIGYIKDESVFESAKQQMEGRIIFEEYIRPQDAIPQFSIAVVKKTDISTTNQLANELIRASGNELSVGYGLYVDNRFMGAVTERSVIDEALGLMLDSYRSEDSSEVVEFVEPVEVRGGLYPVTSITDLDTIQQEIRREEVSQKIYTAQRGDAPVTIAKKNNIPYSELKVLNPEIEKKLLIGQEVLVTKSVPTLGVKVTREVEYEEEVGFKINQVQDTSKDLGYVKVTQEGKKGSIINIAKVTYVDGIESNRTIVSSDVLSEPVNEVVVIGGKQPVARAASVSTSTTTTVATSDRTVSTNFRWPVDGGYVSCGINGYRGHTGMDIAANSGTSVRASASGTVVLAKNTNVGYGRHIIIDHGGGVQTLYAHNSQLKVNVGQWVEQGELIALVGRTGRATGNHLHFEVRVNGRYQDPAKYIGNRNPF